MTIEKYSQYHIVDKDRPVDLHFKNKFCAQVATMYHKMVKP